MYRIAFLIALSVFTLSCTDQGQRNRSLDPNPENPLKALFTQSILSDLDSPEQYADHFFHQILPLVNKENALVVGLFKPTYLEEFSPFNRLRPDELLVMIKWKNISVRNAQQQLNHTLTKFEKTPQFSTRFFESLSNDRKSNVPFTLAENIFFDQSGFYTHRIMARDLRPPALNTDQDSIDEWIFQEISPHAPKKTTNKILVISRYDSHESWEATATDHNQRTSRSISEALHQQKQDGQDVASQIILVPSYLRQ